MTPAVHALIKKDARHHYRRPHAGCFAWATHYCRALGFQVIETKHEGGAVSLDVPAIVLEIRDRGVARSIELARRYKRFRNYMLESRHNWQQIDELHFADNSVEVVEMSELTGTIRNRMTIAPGGDACF